VTPILVTPEAYEDAYTLLSLFKITFDRTPDGEYVIWVDTEFLHWLSPKATQSYSDAIVEIVRIIRILSALP
jgi:hypothetical protein